MFDQLARSTVRIEVPDGRGSGFMIRPDLAVTNHHVINGAKAIRVVSNEGSAADATVVASSPAEDSDFAVLELDAILEGARPLGFSHDQPGRGDLVLFAGFPHGLDDLLVHEARVTGFLGDRHFYLGASVNSGNSGGPIVDSRTGKLVGYVTASRFLGGEDMESMAAEAMKLSAHARQLAAGGGAVQIMGVDFGQLAGWIGHSMELVSKLFVHNANTGIGIGHYTGPLIEAIESR